MPNFIEIEQAALCLQSAHRVLVIGCSGGGKSTLSQKIATRFGLDYQSLDRDVRWLPGWIERERAEQRELTATLVSRDNWVMDGTGSSSFDLRLPRTQLVLWVRVGRWRCLLGVARRVMASYGRVRPDMAPGCPEQLPDRDFLSYIWNFERKYTPEVLRQIDRHGPQVPVCILKSHAEMGRLLDLASVSA